ncbi:MAG: DUF1538 domain-containing protein [Clostridia bacterium]
MMESLFGGIFKVALDVFLALSPLLLAFILFQVLLLKLPKRQVIRMLKGMFLAFLGLTLFLYGVHVGFMPAGEAMGKELSKLPWNWVIIPVGFLLGFAATFAEPAVRVLVDEIDKVSGGYVNKRVMILTLCIGVGVSVALSMVRVLFGLSLWVFIIPGYLMVLTLVNFVSPTYAAIAFDSGGVATGPMTVTFILSLSIGVAGGIEGRNPLLDGFGMVALVALTPILAVLILGYLYKRKERTKDG